MKQGQFLIIAVMLSALSACSHSGKKESAVDQVESINRMNNLGNDPKKVDIEKAAKINLELGMNYLKQEQVARAKSKFNRAKALAPNSSEVQYSYAYFLEYVGEIDNAEKHYQKAVSLHPKGGNEHNNYGAFLCRQHRFLKAEKEFLKAVEDSNYTNTAEAYENAGLCIQQLPDIAKAEEYFEKALRYDPNRSNALIELAIIKYNQHKFTLATDYYSRFSQISKPTSRSVILGIELAKNMGDKDKEASYRLLLNSEFPHANLEQLRKG